MASKTAQPLTPEEQKTLDDLQARQQQAAYEQAEKDRLDRVEALKDVDAILKLIGTEDVTKAIDAALANNALDFNTKSRITNMRQSLDYNVRELQAQVNTANQPTPKPGETLAPTPTA